MGDFSTMTVSMLPLDIKSGSPESNVESVIAQTRKLRVETSVLVLPELFSTGFISNHDEAERLAQNIDGPTIDSLRSYSLERKFAIAGSFLCRDENDGSLRNRSFFINPDNGGEVTYYDKHHLFSMSPEYEIFKSGLHQSPIIHYRGWNIALAVCYEMRFPVWVRNVDNKYDMMLVPANWPDSRAYAWKQLVVARALENQAVFIAANRSGIDEFGTYSYLTSFGVDSRGQVIEEFHGNSLVRHATFDLNSLKEFRERFPVHRDADKFEITLKGSRD